MHEVKRQEFQLEMPEESYNKKNKKKAQQWLHKCLKDGRIKLIISEKYDWNILASGSIECLL